MNSLCSFTQESPMISTSHLQRRAFCQMVVASLLGCAVARSQDTAPARPLVILIGPPMSGKTTFVAPIQRRYGISGISIEDLIKDHAVELRKKHPGGMSLAEMRFDPAISRYVRAW